MEKEGPVKIKSYYKEAFRCINDALKFDEQGREKRQALQLYQKGLRNLITGLSIKLNGTGTEQEKAREMQEKMKDYQYEIETLQRKIEQEHIIDWVERQVIKSITPQQEKESINQCVKDLKSMAASA